ncbi:bcl-2-interacting killer [Engraulis encrasicolus]|uniref:bcl-2-interacting killer n=1 Tax=Engraulis encrasicolus TaxID=184585 RepID=UPI002FD11D06
MVEQTRESPKPASLQAGPVEVDSGMPSDLTAREARVIGQQLAQIGDQLNRRWAHRLPGPRLQPNQWPLDWRTNIFIGARVVRHVFVAEGRRVREVFALGKLWLNPLVYNPSAWVSSLSSAGLGWSAGVLVSTALLATAALCIALWELGKD